jgi:hypothetical protein
MFKTDRTVYKYKEGIYDLMDEKNMNIVSGVCTYSNKKEKKNAFRDLKREFGDSVKIIFQENFLTYTAKVDRNCFF